jgi:hypothetical protein
VAGGGWRIAVSLVPSSPAFLAGMRGARARLRGLRVPRVRREETCGVQLRRPRLLPVVLGPAHGAKRGELGGSHSAGECAAPAVRADSSVVARVVRWLERHGVVEDADNLAALDTDFAEQRVGERRLASGPRATRARACRAGRRAGRSGESAAQRCRDRLLAACGHRRRRRRSTSMCCDHRWAKSASSPYPTAGAPAPPQATIKSEPSIRVPTRKVIRASMRGGKATCVPAESQPRAAIAVRRRVTDLLRAGRSGGDERVRDRARALLRAQILTPPRGRGGHSVRHDERDGVLRGDRAAFGRDRAVRAARRYRLIMAVEQWPVRSATHVCVLPVVVRPTSRRFARSSCRRAAEPPGKTRAAASEQLRAKRAAGRRPPRARCPSQNCS